MSQRSIRAFLFALTVALAALPAAAQTGTLFVEGNSVGIGTETPVKALHVQGSTDATGLRVENTSGTTDGRILMELRNNGGINFLMVDTNGQNWQFIGQTGGSYAGFSISRQGSGVREFRVDPNGNLFLSGSVNPSSSREIKHGFSPVDGGDLLEKLERLPITSWQYLADTSGARHIGPVAEDFYSAFGVGVDAQHISVGDASGIALAAVQEIHRRDQAKEAEIAELKARVAELEALVQRLAAE